VREGEDRTKKEEEEGRTREGGRKQMNEGGPLRGNMGGRRKYSRNKEAQVSTAHLERSYRNKAA